MCLHFFLKNETPNTFHWDKAVSRESRLCATRPVNNDPVALNMDVFTLHLPMLSSSLNCQITSLGWVFSCGFIPFFQIHMNPSQSTLTIEGDDIDRVDKAMQHISYLNSRQFPTPGIRRLKITSVVKYVLVWTEAALCSGGRAWCLWISLVRNKGVLGYVTITHLNTANVFHTSALLFAWEWRRECVRWGGKYCQSAGSVPSVTTSLKVLPVALSQNVEMRPNGNCK